MAAIVGLDEDFGPIYRVTIPGFDGSVDIVRRDNGRVAPNDYEPCHTHTGWPVHVPRSEFDSSNSAASVKRGAYLYNVFPTSVTVPAPD